MRDTVLEPVDDDPSHPEFEAALLADPTGDAAIIYADWLQQHGHPRGELVVVQHALRTRPGDRALLDEEHRIFAAHPELMVRGLELAWENGFIRRARLAEMGSRGDGENIVWELLHHPSGRFLRELVIGRHQGGDADNQLMVDVILRGVERPPPLRALFVGDFDREVDISRAPLGNLSGISLVYPDLEDLQLRGRGDFALDALDLPRLRRFALRTSILPYSRIAAILTARWPALEELELWTGSRTYGATCNAREFERWLASGDGAPRLRVLRIMNSELTDELCEMLVASPRSGALEVLDLSLGTLSDHGAGVLARAAGAFPSLRDLDVTWNALGRTGVAALTRAGLPVRGTGRQKSTRYVSIGE